VPENQSNINLQKNSSVLISGGSGLVGKNLTSRLLSEGFKVSHLSRNANQFGRVRVFRWDPEKKILDPHVFEGVDYLIHLAGANIGEKRWTKNRKEEIIRSRVESARLLHDVVSANHIPLKAFISASATGYYGSITSEAVFNEEDPPAKAGIRTVKIRTAVVLEKNDSALSKIMAPGKFGFLVKTGNGRQYMPWIHIDDLCNIYVKAITDSGMNGAFNAVSPQHVTHNGFMKVLGKVMNRPVLYPSVPSFILRTFLGEMSDVILKGCRVSSEKIEKAGYRFVFGNLEDALNNVISR
jgi:uncharacterized protein (TIGR01777 family)